MLQASVRQNKTSSSSISFIITITMFVRTYVCMYLFVHVFRIHMKANLDSAVASCTAGVRNRNKDWAVFKTGFVTEAKGVRNCV